MFTDCSEFDTLRPDKGKKQDSENMEDSAQDGKFASRNRVLLILSKICFSILFLLLSSLSDLDQELLMAPGVTLLSASERKVPTDPTINNFIYLNNRVPLLWFAFHECSYYNHLSM
jgi:hypothetical protein